MRERAKKKEKKKMMSFVNQYEPLARMAGQWQRISKWRRKRRCSFLYAVRKRGVEEEAERGR